MIPLAIALVSAVVALWAFLGLARHHVDRENDAFRRGFSEGQSSANIDAVARCPLCQGKLGPPAAVSRSPSAPA